MENQYEIEKLLVELNTYTYRIDFSDLKLDYAYKIIDAKKCGDEISVKIKYKKNYAVFDLPKRYLDIVPENKIHLLKNFKLMYMGTYQNERNFYSQFKLFM